MIDTEEIRRKWATDRAQFHALGRIMADRLRKSVQKLGVSAEVSYRAKEVDSLLKKLISKPEYSYETLGDKAGVRIVTRYRKEISSVVAVAQQLFSCGEAEDTADRLAEDKVGYRSRPPPTGRISSVLYPR